MAIAMDVAVFLTVNGAILDAFAELNQSTASFILPLIKTLLEDRHIIDTKTSTNRLLLVDPSILLCDD